MNVYRVTITSVNERTLITDIDKLNIPARNEASAIRIALRMAKPEREPRWHITTVTVGDVPPSKERNP